MNEAEQKELKAKLSLHDQANRIACNLMEEIFKTAEGYDPQLCPKVFLIKRVKKYLADWL